MNHPFDGNMIAAERHNGDAPEDSSCGCCGGDLPPGNDPDQEVCGICAQTQEALDIAADKAAQLTRQFLSAGRSANHLDLKHREMYLSIARRSLSDLVELIDQVPEATQT